MRIVVITDVHANLPALQAALPEITRDGYDLLVHTGDAIGSGPFPSECLDMLLATPRCRFVMGNHDAWFAHGVPDPRPDWMSAGEAEHHRWTHAQIAPSLRRTVAEWPYRIEESFDGVHIAFCHYALDATGRDWLPIVRTPSTSDLDDLFASSGAALTFFGHHHPFRDVSGQHRYINPGSLGCHTEPVARYVVVECARGSHTLTHRSVSYDDAPLARAFEVREVPERALISRTFFGGRFTF